jgi:organic radical activating enzyme
MKTYKINEFFYSLQGEGVRAGEPSLFLRFSNCNLKCAKQTEGFDCDTEFDTGERWTLDQIVENLKTLSSNCKWVVLTGGEPSLQLDDEIIDRLHLEGYKLAIESNGTRELSPKLDWICVSPKSAPENLRQRTADELKYVLAEGMPLPRTIIKAKHYLISPAFEKNCLPPENLQWCIEMTKKNPPWRLSVQQHKGWQVR